MAVMALMAAVIITFGISTGCAMDSAEPCLNDDIQLDMAPHSVDDTYHGCKNEMKSKVLKDFLENEKNGDGNFRQAWEKAWKAKQDPIDPIGKEQAVAINVYTRERPNVYLDFNKAVRTQRSTYKTAFKYHTLHFFLTDALQTLNAKCSNADRSDSLPVYRRTNCNFRQDILNKEIRFGSFTSSSRESYPNVKFGDKSCFEIVTYFGADITKYSVLNGHEKEVLIPPYEVFKVTKIKRRPEHKNLPCEVVYILKSTRRTLSNTNCAFFPKGSLPNVRENT